MVVLVADSPENIARVAAALQLIIPTGLMAVTDVEMLRVEAGL